MEFFTIDLDDSLRDYIVREIKNSDDNDVWEPKKVSEKGKVYINKTVCNAEMVNLYRGKYYQITNSDTTKYNNYTWKDTIFKKQVYYMNNSDDINLTVFSSVYKNELFNNFINSKLELYDGSSLTYSNYQMLRYKKGAKFEEHSDKCVMDGLVRLLFIVPKSISNYSGGELVIYEDDKKTVIEADQEKAVIILLPYQIKHSVNEVTSGARICFKADIIKPKKCEYKKETPLIITKFTEEEIYDNDNDVDDKIISLEEKILELQLKIQKLKTIKNGIYASSFINNTMEDISKNNSGKIIPIPLVNFYDDISDKIELHSTDYELVMRIKEEGYKFSFTTKCCYIHVGDNSHYSHKNPTDPDNYDIHNLIVSTYIEDQTTPNFIEQLTNEYSNPIIFSNYIGLLDPEKESYYNDEYNTYYNTVHVTILLVLK